MPWSYLLKATRQELCLLPDFAGMLQARSVLWSPNLCHALTIRVRAAGPKDEPRQKDGTWGVTPVMKSVTSMENP